MCQPRVDTDGAIIQKPIFEACECSLVFARDSLDSCILCVDPHKARKKNDRAEGYFASFFLLLALVFPLFTLLPEYGRLIPMFIGMLAVGFGIALMVVIRQGRFEVIPEPKAGKLHFHMGHSRGVELWERLSRYDFPGKEFDLYVTGYLSSFVSHVCLRKSDTWVWVKKVPFQNWRGFYGDKFTRHQLSLGELCSSKWRGMVLEVRANYKELARLGENLSCVHTEYVSKRQEAETYRGLCNEALEWISRYSRNLSNPSPVLMDLLAHLLKVVDSSASTDGSKFALKVHGLRTLNLRLDKALRSASARLQKLGELP